MTDRIRRDHEHMRLALEAPTSTESLRAMTDFHSGVFDDVVSTQLPGWGASDFLVHGNETHFQIVAEFRGGSGSMFDRSYAANALRTWHELASEVVRLREVARSADQLAGAVRELNYVLPDCGCTEKHRCRLHAALENYFEATRRREL